MQQERGHNVGGTWAEHGQNVANVVHCFCKGLALGRHCAHALPVHQAFEKHKTVSSYGCYHADLQKSMKEMHH